MTRYLLGSGGTLLFDLTIMLQSLWYGSAPPVAQTPDRMPPSTATRRRLFRRRKEHAESGLHQSQFIHPHHSTHHHTERSPLLSGNAYLAESQRMTADGSPHMASSQLYRSGSTSMSTRSRSKSPGANTALRMTLGSRSPGRSVRRDFSMEAVAERGQDPAARDH